VVVRLVGEIDLSNAGEVGGAIRSRVPNHARALVLDLSEVRYVDSSGLAVLFDLRRRLVSRRQELRVVVPRESHILRVLELVDLDATAVYEGSLEAALAEIPGPPA
jgi:anti-sigma B factor antagonist